MEKTLAVTKALADGNRLRVLIALTKRDELCVCQITEMLKLAPATVSRHMSVLQNAHLVKSRKDSRWVYYRLSDCFPPSLLKWLKESLAQSKELENDDNRLKCIIAQGLDPLCRMQNSKRGYHTGQLHK
ncbi:MAG: metalloregulator ArsR/SmtB family transcription factor [Candidatus Eremiobacteraeota bacterium]|nr:metalloregulator ArsR/SmtB family transcription factor [Candidatus Eremiobacteraeota bacterium]